MDTCHAVIESLERVKSRMNSGNIDWQAESELDLTEALSELRNLDREGYAQVVEKITKVFALVYRVESENLKNLTDETADA